LRTSLDSGPGHAAGGDLRAEGVRALPKPLRFYASDQVHSCHQKALVILGLGHQALNLVPTDTAFRIDIAALEAAIAEDRARGFAPAAVIATAGTVNTGAIDDLQAVGVQHAGADGHNPPSGRAARSA
jgi:glutamate/tyrosine decarboxylase-like PLP-dependent enzyme